MAYNKEKKSIRDKRYYEVRKEKKSETHKKWLVANKERLKEYRKKFYEENKEVLLAKSKKWAEENKESRRNSSLKYTYGITLEEYNELFQKQDGVCFGCKKHQSELEKPLCVDHCHRTGKIRGLLCSNCNVALGFVKDDANILENLIKHLRNHEQHIITAKNKRKT